MAEFINSVDVLGDDTVTDSIIYRNITNYSDSSVTSIGANAFAECIALTKVDLPMIISISNRAFANCSALDALILRNTTQVVTCESSYVFVNSKIKSGGTGYIYVPSALVDSYKAATNWSKLASQIRAIEDYPEICGG